MMKRKIVEIDEEKCNGCAACVTACHEGAIGLIDGKAKLLKEIYCDGLGDCLPACPMGAIKIIEREAEDYDEKATELHKAEAVKTVCGCPGSAAKEIRRTKPDSVCGEVAECCESRLTNWPVQIKLANISSPFFRNASLLIAADCSAYAYGNFHTDFISGKSVLIGCPKLDNTDYSEKLADIFANNEIAEITLVRMEVPCCGGLEYFVKNALEKAGKNIAVKVVTVSAEGNIVK